MQSEIVVDKNFSIDVNKKIFRYEEGGNTKILPVSKIVSCEVYADMSVVKGQDIKSYIQTSYGVIPYFENSSDLIKIISSAGTVLKIYFKDENGELKSYGKKYGKDETVQYEIRGLINSLIEENDAEETTL